MDVFNAFFLAENSFLLNHDYFLLRFNSQGCLNYPQPFVFLFLFCRKRNSQTSQLKPNFVSSRCQHIVKIVLPCLALKNNFLYSVCLHEEFLTVILLTEEANLFIKGQLRYKNQLVSDRWATNQFFLGNPFFFIDRNAWRYLPKRS